MGKPSKKRKSEGDLPAAKGKKSRPTTGRARTGSPEPEPQPSSSLLVEEHKAAPKHDKKGRAPHRRSAPITRHVDEEYEEDTGRIESQKFLQMVQAAAMKKKKDAKFAHQFMEIFKGSIQSEGSSLKQLLKRLGDTTRQQDQDFMDNFTKAYTASRPARPPQTMIASGNGSQAEIFFATLYERSLNIIQTGRNIVKRFEEVDEQVARTDAVDTSGEGWEKELDAMMSLVAIGAKVGEQKVQALLHGEEIPTVDDDETEFVKALYHEEKEAEWGWGKVARKQVRATKKLYNTTLALQPAI